MYCLQWLLPVLLISKPSSPLHLQNQVVFAALYLVGAVLERKPCLICLLLFLLTTTILCVPGLEMASLYRLLSLDYSVSPSSTTFTSSSSLNVCS